MANMKKPPGRANGNGGVQDCNVQAQNTFASECNQALAELFEIPNWVSWHLVLNPKTGKLDKIPHDGKRGLSTVNPSQWMPYAAAAAIAEHPDIDGVGLVMTGGIDDGDRRLVGLDFDDVDFEHFTLPWHTYAERSPSGRGVRAFLWAPIAWASRFKDTTDCRPPGCDHAEIYLGSSGRFLTTTFNAINEYPIARIDAAELAVLESWGMRKFEPDKPLVLPEGIGEPVNLTNYSLTPDQQQLVAGTGDLDRSRVFIGLAIKLIDRDVSLDDLLATIMATPALWAYCMSHRRDDQARALQFAREEIGRAFAKSMTGMRANLVGFNQKPPPSKPPAIQFPAPFRGPMAEAVAAGLEVAHKPQPELTTMAVLSAFAASCGSFYRQQNGGRLNLYFLGVARTGTGKDLPLRLAKQIGRIGNAKLIGAPGSGQGLEDALASNIATYCVVDEIAHFFSAMNDPKASGYERANARKLLELFSASSDNYETRALAGKEARTIQHPAFNLVGFTTPEKLGNAFDPDDFADGLAGRILFVVTDNNPPARRVKQAMVLPESVKRRAHRIELGMAYTMMRAGGAIVINVADDAERMLDALLTEFDQRGRVTDSPWESALYARSMEKLERIAGVLAAWDDPSKPVITTEHIEWAAQFVRASNAGVLGFIKAHMFGGEEQKNAAELLSMIRDGATKPRATSKSEVAACKAGLVPRSALLRRARSLNKKDFDAAIAYLQAQGEITTGTLEGTSLQVLGAKGDE